VVGVTGHVTCWYWTSDSVLRECVVMEVEVFGGVTRVVIDLESGESVNVAPEDVLIEKPA
jgi:hypothetical protein